MNVMDYIRENLTEEQWLNTMYEYLCIRDFKVETEYSERYCAKEYGQGDCRKCFASTVIEKL